MTVQSPTRTDVKVIAVIGTGTMGSGIAQIAAMSGYKTLLNDIEQSFVERAMSAVGKSLDKFVQKQTLAAEERDRVLARMSTATDLGALSEADLVIEAVTEKIEVKRELFGRLDKICPERTLFATNTSSLSVTEMARATARPERVVGMHFFNPPALMKLVEVVRTPLTSEAAFATVWEVAQKMGKVPVETRDTPGFIFNRLIIPYLNEAIWAVYEGVGKVDDIDRAMKLGGNMPIGPLALLDLIGIDVQLHACGAMHDELGDPKFRVCPLNRQMVRAGYLGRKSGKGFYDYGSEPPTPVDFSVFKF